jgi:sarcosine oxidase
MGLSSAEWARSRAMADRRGTSLDADVIVVGLGGLGSAAAYWLARAGVRVLGFEQFEIGHDRGASQDHSRLIRLSYHTEGYVRLARAAYEVWADVEADSGDQLVIPTGGLDLAPVGSIAPLDDYATAMTAANVTFERLGADEVMHRWPQFRLTDDVDVIYQAETGICAADRANAAHIRLARTRGARLVERMPVTLVRSEGKGVEVSAGGEVFRAAQAIVATDAWTNTLLEPLGVRLPLVVTREQVVYFEPIDPAAFAIGRFPSWIWSDVPSFYGFPDFDGGGPKVAEDIGGRIVTADGRDFEPDPVALARLEAFVGRMLPGANGSIHRIKTCLYTLTPDRDFVIDAVPGHPGIFLALGAAHSFKFASLIGRTLCELVTGGSTANDLAPFRMDRPILTMTDPPRAWMPGVPFEPQAAPLSGNVPTG